MSSRSINLRSWKTRIILFLAVLGPGFITANVDNDSGGIFTYSQAGAAYGYTLLWTMIPITLALIVVQEMCARMGAVTGKGLSDLIREEFGLRMTFIILILLVIVNFTNVITEFSGIASSMGLFHISKFICVPLSALLVWALVVKGDYKKVEKVFLIASVFYIAYIVTGVISGPDWHLALVETIKLPKRSVWSDKTYVYMTVGVIGTTITPWMQFYLQSSIVEKGVTVRQYKASRLDVIVGSIFTDIVAWFIVVACAATLYTHGMRDIADASTAAEAMKPLAGQYAFILFAAGLFNASLFAASILPLTTAYTVCEGLGFESGLDKQWGEAPFFYWFYTLLIALGAGVVLIPNFPMVKVAILSQVLNGVLLPVILIFMLRLINKHELMGKYVNSLWFNIVAWATAVIVIGLSSVLVFNALHG
ncbi:NRAMP (natural resistance-associated macrophage protein) metal ion transporters [Granulicella rosea]|uniref:NRAMP (Natural resistance-associated macrophage protein) metal ion transporters n=1 Tax=Granulicella rosea TaxID=474952 RepID=A0A239EVJ4_9BACT|nr:Nramp family divalent metal transporter [Granulicella rosea]SNS48629.1 NRAMP (natural resistance-associated macrophage protein) metal ion transporters [Granulicella rosea]